MTLETNVLKGVCFQGVEPKRFQHGVKLNVNLHLLTECAAQPSKRLSRAGPSTTNSISFSSPIGIIIQ